MTTESAVAALPRTAAPARTRWSTRLTRWALGGNAALLFAFLYLPVIILAVLMLSPLAMEQYKLYVGSLVLIYVILAIGLNLTLGYAGQISLAQGAFVGIGAYAAAIMTTQGMPLVAALAVAIVLSFAIGWTQSGCA